MNKEYTYVGAFLELTNIWTTRPKEVDACPIHGESGFTSKSCGFCPQCGSKIIKVNKEEKCHKNICDWDGKKSKWEDKMVSVWVEGEEYKDRIILIPNHRKTGEIQGFNDSDSSICYMHPGMFVDCTSLLSKSYADYIEWLTSVREFKVGVRFGLIKYWN